MKSCSSWLSGRKRRACQHFITHHHPDSFLHWSCDCSYQGVAWRESSWFSAFLLTPPSSSILQHLHIFFLPHLALLISFQSFLLASGQFLNLPLNWWPEKCLRPVIPQQQDRRYRDTRETVLGGLWLFSLFSAIVFMKKQNHASRKSTSACPWPFCTTEELWPASPSGAMKVVLKK